MSSSAAAPTGTMLVASNFAGTELLALRKIAATGLRWMLERFNQQKTWLDRLQRRFVQIVKERVILPAGQWRANRS